MAMISRGRLMWVATFLCALAACYAGNANAQAPCPDDGMVRPECTKEIRILNNTDATIYPVLQGSIQLTDALGAGGKCLRVSSTTGGDVWLQAALGDNSKCYPVKNDYYVYINPTTGIPKHSVASINVPWWSKRAAPTPDLYVDWWRGGRIIMFDDKTALNDSYSTLIGTPQVKFATGSPRVSCKSVAGNKCLPGQLQIFQVPAAAEIATKSPAQLNEYTFADVKAVKGGGTSGGEFLDLNQGYNVSNVDQVYLPVAIEPVRLPADIGYMGTVATVPTFRKTLSTFTGADMNPTNPPFWPIYNNPMFKGKPLYPNAGIRVPSALALFNFYMNPYYFPPPLPLRTAEIIPPTPPKLVNNIMTQWTNCTTGKGNCPQRKLYLEVKAVFDAAYKIYKTNCTPPPYLAPVGMTGLPSMAAYQRFVHGWVPFNTNKPGTTCSVPDLPTINMPPAGNRTPIDYIRLQYNYRDVALSQAQWFNPYTQLIHDDVGAMPPGLAANAYAFSIDDEASFLSNDGGTTPGGLIIAVGGDTGLPNKSQVPPPLPKVYRYFNFSVTLPGPNVMDKGPVWTRYGVCSPTVTDNFPPPDTNGFQVFGIDPEVYNINTTPCPLTLMDAKNRTYQMIILKAGIPPANIWPKFVPSAGTNFDPTVIKCPSASGLVPAAMWCNYLTEESDPPPTSPPVYALSPRGPIP